MTVLITGATGLLGTRLLPRLAQAGVDCRALIRPGSTVPAGVSAVEGDILDPASLPEAVRIFRALRGRTTPPTRRCPTPPARSRRSGRCVTVG